MSASSFQSRRGCALTRRCASIFYMFVNCQPARRMCLPVLAPAQAFVRAGERRGKMRNSELRCGDGCARRCVPAAAFCHWRASVHCVSVAALCPHARSAIRFCRDALPLAYVQRCVSVAALCHWRMFSDAFLSRRFAIGACSAMRLCRGALPSARARRCSSVVTFCIGVCSAMRLWRGAYPRFTPAVCRMATNRTACDMLRFYSAGSRSPFVCSRCVGAVICLCGFTSGLGVSCRRSRRGAGDGVTGDAGNGAGGAAIVRFCAAALALRVFPRGVRWG